MMQRWIFEISAEVALDLEVEAESFSKAEANAKDLLHERRGEFRVLRFTNVYLKQSAK